MSNQPYCTGPCEILAAVGNNSAALSVGFSEVGVQIEDIDETSPLMNDFAGNRIPLDIQNMGQHALLSWTLTSWNEGAVARMEARQHGGVRGADPLGATGALLLTEGLAFTLWLRYVFGSAPGMVNKAAYRNLGNGVMEPGRRYLACLSERRRFKAGTEALKKSFNLHAIPVTAPGGSRVLYDYNLAGLPVLAG